LGLGQLAGQVLLLLVETLAVMVLPMDRVVEDLALALLVADLALTVL
jgi:hypothetical protein